MLTTSLYSSFAAQERISKKRALPDQPENSSSKHQKPETPLSLAEGPLDPATRRFCNSISSALGGSGWKTQRVGTLGFITHRCVTSLYLVEKAISASLRHPSSAKEPRNGLFPAVLCRAFIKANAIRVYKIKNGTLRGSASQNWDRLADGDYRLAATLLKSKSESECSFMTNSRAQSS